VMEPRDNILFELGLFVGRLGLSSAAFVIDKGIKILSDISGISLLRFTKGDVKNFMDQIEHVKVFFNN